MFKGFSLGVVMVIAAAILCVYVVLRTGLIPAGADTTPTWIETWAADTSLHATLNREAPRGPNPVVLTDANLIAGIQLYATRCAICHGTAEGDASASPVARGENPVPPNWRRMASKTILKVSPFGK